MKCFYRSILSASIISVLAACGGGGSGNSTVPPVAEIPVVPVVPIKPVDPIITSPKTELSVICSGADCGAQNSNTYSGAGIGLWAYENTGTQEAVIPVNINGVTGKTATIIYTNLNTNAQPLKTPNTSNISANILKVNLPAQQTNDERIKHFNIEGYKSMLKNVESKDNISRTLVTAPNNAVVGDTKVWNYSQSTGPSVKATFTLVQQVSAYDGKKINFWVDVNEYAPSKVLEADVTDIANKFATGSDSLYKNIIDFAGQPFGTNTFSNLIPPSNQSINVVIANLNPDKSPYGQIGYFTSENNFLKSSIASSNEALTVFLDSETLYIPVPGTERAKARVVITSSLVHEFTHLVNFYQRGVLKRASFPNTWLEETSALGMEDVLNIKISPTYSLQRDNRYPAYLSDAQYNCPMHLFSAGCDDYQRSSTFISFLNRKYGVSFLSGLLKNFSSTDAVTLMDNQIKASGGIGYQDELKKFSTNFALLPANNVPAGFGFPAVVSQGFTLPAIYSSDYPSYRVLPTQPATLNANGSMYYYEVKNLQNSFTQNIPVPAKTNISIVIK